MSLHILCLFSNALVYAGVKWPILSLLFKAQAFVTVDL